MCRGIKDHLDRWTNDLLARHLPYKYDKDKEKGLVQLAVRPLVFYEIVFPEDQLEEVLRTVKPTPYERYKYFNGIITMIRKLLGLKKVPKYTDDKNFRVVNQWVGVHAIGIKKDSFDKDGIEQL